jgi:hypothetical protein
MEEFELRQGIKPMTVFTHKIRGPYPEKTVGGIAFNIDARALDR